MDKFNFEQKTVISIIFSPILVILIIGFLTMKFDITKWDVSTRRISLLLLIPAFVLIYAVLDSFKQNKKKKNEHNRN